MTTRLSKFSLQDAIDFELVDIYLKQSRITVGFGLVLAVFLAASFYQIAPWQNILLWLFLMLAISFFVLYTSLDFHEGLPAYEINFFRKRQHVLHVLIGLVWGAAFFLLLDGVDPGAGDYRVAVVIAVIIAISATSKAASLTGLVGFLLAVGGLTAWHFIVHFDMFGWWLMGLAGLLIVSFVFGFMTNQYILGQVENKMINEGYVEQIRALQDKIEKTNEDFIKRNIELQKIQEQLELLAAHDALTGLYNRRYILERIEEKLPEIRRHQLDCCFVLMDVDYFKDVNDGYGHLAGDDVLKAISQILMNGVRQGDIVARYGGEEFLIFLPMTELESAHVLVERLRLALEEYIHVIEHEKLTVTASFGIAQHMIHDSADKTIAKADEALYEAKVAGRNRIVASPNTDFS